MSVKTDYYALLDIDRNSEPEVIEKKIKQEISKWRRRTEISDLSLRQEAERRMELLNEAKRNLLEPSNRVEYDRELTTRGVEQSAPLQPENGQIDWINEARKHVERNQYNDALYATQMALNSGISTPELWFLRSRANGGLGEFDDALYEAKRAQSGAPNEAAYVQQLADIYLATDDYPNALEAFDKASHLDPSQIFFPIMKIGLLAELDQHEECLELARKLRMDHPDDENAREAFTMALLATAASKFSNAEKIPMQYFASQEDWDQFCALIDELKEQEISEDPEAAFDQRRIIEHRDRLAKNRFAPVFYFQQTWSSLVRWDPETWRGKTLIGLTLIYKASFLLTGFLLIIAGHPIIGLLLMTISGFAIWGSYKPGWKADKQWAEAMDNSTGWSPS